MPVLGFLCTLTSADSANLKAAFIAGVSSTVNAANAAYVDVAFTAGVQPVGVIAATSMRVWDFWADGVYGNLTAGANTLVNTAVGNIPQVIVAAGGLVAAKAVESALIGAPAVSKMVLFAGGRVRGDDPAGEHQIGAINGFYLETTRKRLEDHETRQMLGLVLPPRKAKIFHMINDTSIVNDDESQWKVRRVVANTTVAGPAAATINSAIDSAVARKADALVVSADPFFNRNRAAIIARVANQLPVCYPFREYVDAGGFMSIGPSLRRTYLQLGMWAAMLDTGPALAPEDLPLNTKMRPELVVNARAGRVLLAANKITKDGFNALLAMADDVVFA